MLKVAVKPNQADDLRNKLKEYPVKILEERGEQWVLEIAGGEEEIDELLKILEPFKTRDMVRTGKIALPK